MSASVTKSARKDVRKDERLLAKLILSGALVAVSAAYGYWQKSAPKVPRPVLAALPSSVPLSAPPSALPLAAENPAPASPDGSGTKAPATAPAATVTAPAVPAAIMAKAAPPPPVAAATAPVAAPAVTAPAAPPVLPQAASGAAIYAEAGSHIEDGQYISAPKDFQWGTVQIQAQIKNGVFTDIRFLQIPDHRPQSAELSDLSKPILVAETIQGQKAGVDIVSSATYTSFAYQDALTDVIVRATRR